MNQSQCACSSSRHSQSSTVAILPSNQCNKQHLHPSQPASDVPVFHSQYHRPAINTYGINQRSIITRRTQQCQKITQKCSSSTLMLHGHLRNHRSLVRSWSPAACSKSEPKEHGNTGTPSCHWPSRSTQQNLPSSSFQTTCGHGSTVAAANELNLQSSSRRRRCGPAGATAGATAGAGALAGGGGDSSGGRSGWGRG